MKESETISMKVLQLISSGGHYGAENMLLNLAQGLQTAGDDVTVGIFHNAQNPNLEIAARLQERGIVVEIVSCGGRFDWGTVRAIRKIIQGRSIEVVHAHGYKADLYALAATRWLQMPLVATCHSWPGKSLPLRIYAALDRYGLRYFSRVASVSEEAAERLRESGVPPKKVTNIPNGIDTRAFTRAVPSETIRTNQPGEIVVGMVGRLVREKGCEVLLRAGVEIVSEFPGVRIVYVGEGPERASLQQHAHELGLDRNVYFSGKRQDMPGVYAAFDICVLPSFSEGMPMALLEAMAAGRAVIATRVGEIPKLVVHEETGLLVRPNQVGELRDALLRLLRDSNLRQTMGRKGAARVSQLFSLERMTKSYSELYMKLTDNPVLSDATATLRENPHTQSR